MKSSTEEPADAHNKEPSFAVRNVLRSLVGWKRRDALRRMLSGGLRDEMWIRVVMNRESRKLIDGLGAERLKALEISGTLGTQFKFKDYKQVDWPEFDICKNTLNETFDLILAEQVFEHLIDPYSAGKNVYQMLNKGGHFFVSTPFLVRIHEHPFDCTRWSETGLRNFLIKCGFSDGAIQTSSWGNKACVKANLSSFVLYRSMIHSLRNDSRYPCVVWALAGK